jgi:hypothetical protein
MPAGPTASFYDGVLRIDVLRDAGSNLVQVWDAGGMVTFSIDKGPTSGPLAMTRLEVLAGDRDSVDVVHDRDAMHEVCGNLGGVRYHRQYLTEGYGLWSTEGVVDRLFEDGEARYAARYIGPDPRYWWRFSDPDLTEGNECRNWMRRQGGMVPPKVENDARAISRNVDSELVLAEAFFRRKRHGKTYGA